MSENTALEKAISATGLNELARRLGITKRAVIKWRETGRVPAERVGQLMAASDHPLTAEEIRPDLAKVFGGRSTQDRAA